MAEYFAYNFPLPESIINNLINGNVFSSTAGVKVIEGNSWFVPMIQLDGSVNSLSEEQMTETTLLIFTRNNPLPMYVDNVFIDIINKSLGRILGLGDHAGIIFTATFNILTWWSVIGKVLFATFIVIRAFLRKHFDW